MQFNHAPKNVTTNTVTTTTVTTTVATTAVKAATEELRKLLGVTHPQRKWDSDTKWLFVRLAQIEGGGKATSLEERERMLAQLERAARTWKVDASPEALFLIVGFSWREAWSAARSLGSPTWGGMYSVY